MKVIHCGKCDAIIGASERVCPACGEDIKFAKCPDCGNVVFVDSDKCSLCGSSIVKEGEPGKYAKPKKAVKEPKKEKITRKKGLSSTAKRNVITSVAALGVVAALTAGIVALYPTIDKALTNSSAHKEDKKIISAADKYSEALIDRRAKDLSQYVNASNQKEYREEVSNFFDFEKMYGKETAKVYDAIADSIEYTIDEDSIDSDKNSADISVVFTIKDYESLMADSENLVSADAFISALESADTTTISMTYTMDKKGGDWLLSNSDQIINKVYGFTKSDLYFINHLTADCIAYGTWFYAVDYSAGIYYNTEYINLDLTLNSYGDDCDIYTYYTVEYNGDLVFTSVAGDYLDLFYGEAQGAILTNGCVPAGAYKFSLYEAQTNELLYEDECTVEIKDVTDDYTLTWWYNEGFEGDVAYYEDTTYIDCDLVSNFAFGGYYTVEKDGKLVYTSDVSNSASIYAFYSKDNSDVDVELTKDGYLAEGEYTISFYKEDGTLIASSYCNVYTT